MLEQLQKLALIRPTTVKTLGELLLSEMLPEDALPEQMIEKKNLLRKLYDFVRKNPDKAGVTIDKLNRLGHDLATKSGYSITLEDITPPAQARTLIEDAFARIAKENDPEKRREAIIKARQKLLEVLPKYAANNAQYALVRSGARGNVEQYLRSYVAPIAARGPTGPLPWFIKHGFSSGLRPSEYIATAVEARLNNIAAHFAITQPGDFSKILVNTMADQVVTIEDCKTTNGIVLSTKDPNIIDRFLAKPIGKFTAGTLITPALATELATKYDSVVVRSPMTCEADEGVCQRCYGLSERGNLPTLGTNVGIRSAQAITEPLTQFALSSKHNVHAIKKAAQTNTIKELRQFLDVPKIFSGKAILATTSGKVETIEKAPQGGSFIIIDGVKHYAPPMQEILVKVGQNVYKGDVLTTGIPPPNEVVRYKGLGVGRAYVVDKLYNTYKDQGFDMDRRHFELLAKSHLNFVRIEDDKHNRFIPGEIVKYNTFKKSLGSSKEVPLEEAAGHFLYESYLHFLAGTPVTKDVIAALKAAGYKTVKIALDAPKFSFFMAPVTATPLLNPDWMARLGHRFLKQELLEGIRMGQKSDIHGVHPIPAYAYGAEFGKGPPGRY